ncbi:MAG TPA: DUF3291 domain-containing protein [Terriglobales bacterium]|nr:DUF3291 domain-containing protein [Terriglobales bacterium]
MSHRLAFFTVGVMHEPVGHARVQGFMDRVPGVYAAADSSAGFHSRSIRDLATWKHSWGEPVVPQCYPKIDKLEQFAMTLSLWDDLESVAAFAYKGPHGEALAYRKDWFQSLGLPPYVAWWVSDDHQVSWKQGAERLDHLHAHGSSAFAFNFKEPFDANGNSVKLDNWAMQAQAKKNVAGKA